ncbi:MAG: hypothetical protein IV094_02545 [Vitreoscilla sp.]|nr:hypothetical protein [Vitreoscilla sp.]
MATRKTASKPAAQPAQGRAAATPSAPLPDKPAKSVAVPIAKKAVPASEGGSGKPKLVRDSFTIPKSEYAVLGDLKQRATRLGQPAKKSELIRAGIGALNRLTDKGFQAALASVPSLKTGRPKGKKGAAAK